METPPEKPLHTTSFVVHATRGLIRDQNMRRWAMFILLIVALLLLCAGSTFLASALNPREHLVRALLFWFVVGWLTLTALLLALFDLLIVRVTGRRAEQMLREQLARSGESSGVDERD